MGKPIDKNKPTKNLDELLGHLSKGGDDLDAFEQEALEGFATLESTQEAIEMKQRLDKRMEEKLGEKRKPLFIYWSAAAGLALIIGLIFMMNSNKDLKSESGLAVNSVNDEKSLEQIENNPAAPPAELKKDEKSGKETMGAMGGKGNSQQSGLGGDDLKQQGPAQKAAQDVDSRNNESPVTLAESGETEKDANKKSEDSKRADNSKLDDAIATNSSNNKNQNNQSVPGYNNVSAGASAQNNDANSEKTKSKNPSKESKDEEQTEPKATEYFTARKAKKDKEKDKSSAQADTKPASEIEGKFENSSIKTANLSIKESDLKAKMDKFFSDKDYKRSFNCTLTIGADDKVEGVVFQNPELFHKGEQKEIVDFFKKLKCFKNHEFAVYSTYVVKYQAQ
jgi:hypothetical protein